MEGLTSKNTAFSSMEFLKVLSGADLGFVELKAYTTGGFSFNRKNIKLDTRLWKGS